ncbi:MAG: flippase-like domain-containing protein [candidate division Zixibacteria bacterium]|nr:flippase-like domain-containing protein [candidate division Zixibacteria bacterium]
MSHKKEIVVLLKVILTLVILYFLVRQVGKNWADIKDYDWQFNPVYLILSIICGLAAFLFFALSWRGIIGGFGYKVDIPAAFKIMYLSNLGRYIPGKVWQVFGILYLTRKKGIPPEPAGTSFVVFQLFTIPASLLLFVLASQWDSRILIDQVQLLGPYSALLLTISMLAFCAVLVFWPAPFLKAANYGLKKISRQPLKFQLDKKVALTVFLGYFFSWVLYGLAFWWFVTAVAEDYPVGIIAAMGIFSFAYQVGYLVLFAPGGFGPREVVMGALLTPFLGPVAAAVAILARLWSIVIEAIAALISFFIKINNKD